MMELGLPIALSTDFNPGAGYSEAMSFVLSLAGIKLKMFPIEAIACATLNAAYACGIGDKVGSLEISKQADIIILDAPNHKYIPYHYGINLVETVIKKGKVVVQND
jgi:imidazolonepropionase